MITYQVLRVRIQYYILDYDRIVVNSSVRTFIGRNIMELSQWLDRYFLNDVKSLMSAKLHGEYNFHCTAHISIDDVNSKYNNVEHNISSTMSIDDGEYHKLITRVSDLTHACILESNILGHEGYCEGHISSQDLHTL